METERRLIIDSVAIQLEAGASFKKHEYNLNSIARMNVGIQYPGHPGLLTVYAYPIDWMLTIDPSDVSLFQPGDGCRECVANNARAETALKNNPDKLVLALGNISYVETWKKGFAPPTSHARPVDPTDTRDLTLVYKDKSEQE